MITHPAFSIQDWSVREEELHPDILAQTESLFALSNGHIGLRGNLDEGEPCGLPGTYLNSVYESLPLPYAETAYGYPPSGQAVINVTNGKLIRLLVDDEPFDVRYGSVQSHERELDLRAGLLRRNVRWTSPAGQTIRVASTRLVSLTQRAIAAIAYEVEALDGPVRVVLQSELVANEEFSMATGDPRAGSVSTAPMICEEHDVHEKIGLLIHRTQSSGLRVAAAMDHHIEGPPDTMIEAESSTNVARITITTLLKHGERLRIVKFLAYGWSSERSRPALHDQVMAALAAARLLGWENLCNEQRVYLDEFWARADVELEGNPEVQQAVRFALFHVLQAGSRAEQRPIPAKGLTGPGYDGHTFWDTEIFVLPLLTQVLPQAAGDVLRWRASTLPQARERARQLSLRGAAFPWRTINGEECSGYWPAGTAAFHINADIAYAVTNYLQVTGDAVFAETVALELLVETARLWLSLGYHDVDGWFRIDGVTGPDEYSALADNNVYTNLLAQRNLRAATIVVEQYPAAAAKLGVDASEIAAWQAAAEHMYIPYDERLGVTPQDESFTKHAAWDFAHTGPDQYPLFLHFTYFDLYRKQVVKQADLVLAMYLRGEVFSPQQKARNFAYYEPMTVRDSSLSAAPQAVMAAEVGQLELAYNYLCEAALMDLDDLEHNVRDGIHMASLAGTWLALVAGFGGLRVRESEVALTFMPKLAENLKRLSFRLVFRGRRLLVDIRPEEATYHLLDGESLPVLHYEQEITLSKDQPITCAIPEIQSGPRPAQPPGRAPLCE